MLLTFTEPLDPVLTVVHVLDASGARVEVGRTEIRDVALMPVLRHCVFVRAGAGSEYVRREGARDDSLNSPRGRPPPASRRINDVATRARLRSGFRGAPRLGLS